MGNSGQYDETKHARGSDGKFAAKSTSESDITLDWNDYHEPQSIDLGEDDLTDAQITVDEEGRTSISANIEVNFADDINPEVLDAHPVVAFDHVENRFGVSRIGTLDDPSDGVRFEMTSESRFVNDDEEAISNFYSTTKAREFKDSVNGGPIEPLGKSVRRAYEMWGLDPDDESRNDLARPDLNSDELKQEVRTNGMYERDGRVWTRNPTNSKVYDPTLDSVYDENVLFVYNPKNDTVRLRDLI